METRDLCVDVARAGLLLAATSRPISRSTRGRISGLPAHLMAVSGGFHTPLRLNSTRPLIQVGRGLICPYILVQGENRCKI